MDPYFFIFSGATSIFYFFTTFQIVDVANNFRIHITCDLLSLQYIYVFKKSISSTANGNATSAFTSANYVSVSLQFVGGFFQLEAT